MYFDFFQNACKSESVKERFGLCDDASARHAYIDEENREKWIGVVKNLHNKQVVFYAVDNCVIVRKESGDLESTCDGILVDSKKLVFVELKQAIRPGWFAEGKKQIVNTIRFLRSQNELSSFSSVEAYVCNNLRPKANSSRANSLQQFKDDTGFLIFDSNEIKI